MSRPQKPNKPYPDFPLFAHATRRWAKKIRGKTCYFGPWSDPYGALAKYQEQRDDLHAGRKPRQDEAGVTVGDLITRFLDSKERKYNSGGIVHVTFEEYGRTCRRIALAFGLGRMIAGLRSEDFEALRSSLSATLGPIALGNEIQRVRCIFRYAVKAGLLDRPLAYGDSFERPSRKAARLARHASGPKLFTRSELRRLLAAANFPIRAMVLLGINCGFGNADCGRLPLAAVDLDSGWVDFPRPKTGMPRRCPLWPETVAALRDSAQRRPVPANDDAAQLVFLTGAGLTFAKEQHAQSVGKRTVRALARIGITRPRLGFYALRHTFATIAGDTGDQVAVDAIMGHVAAVDTIGNVRAVDTMPANYRHAVFDDRLQAVVAHVRRWLFPETVPGFVGPAEIS